MIILRSGRHRLGSITASSNPKLVEALRTVQGYTQTVKAIAGLRQQAPKVSVGQSVESVNGDLYGEILVSGVIPGDFLDRYRVAQTAEAVLELAQAGLNRIHEDLLQTLDMITEGALPGVCAWLDSELQSVFGELRELRDVPSDPAEAIARGKAEQWQRSTQLRAEYAQIRAASRVVLEHTSTLTMQPQALRTAWPVVGHAAGLGAIWPELPEWYAGTRQKDAAGRTLKLTPPWPDVDSDEFLTWLLQHPEARPWVPTADQAQELLDQIVSSAAEGKKAAAKKAQIEDEAELSQRNRRHLSPMDRVYAARRQMWGMPTHTTGLDDNVGLRPEERM